MAHVPLQRTAASELRSHWLGRAFQAAGIDPTHWDPDRGVDVNRRTIERVYAYYGQLYLRHARLEWAGMANLVGPSFYAGFLEDPATWVLLAIGASLAASPGSRQPLQGSAAAPATAAALPAR